MADVKVHNHDVKAQSHDEEQLPDLYQLLEDSNRSVHLGEEFERYFPKDDTARFVGESASGIEEFRTLELPEINDLLQRSDEAYSYEQSINLSEYQSLPNSTFYHPSRKYDILNGQPSSHFHQDHNLIPVEPIRFQSCNMIEHGFEMSSTLESGSCHHWEVDKLPFHFSLRMRRTNRRKKGKLWQFLLDLLASKDTNPSIIKWEHKPLGIFCILDCDQVATLWGKRKSNPSMTFEKLSRALRYYYELNILMKIEGHRLLYQFGDLSKA